MKTLLIQHLYFLNGIGGTEKICVTLANVLSANGYEVEIGTNENVIGKPMFSLDENVRVTNIYDVNLEQKEEIPIYNYQGKNPLLWIKYKIKKKYAKWYNRRLRLQMGGEDKLYQYNLRNRAIAWKAYIDQIKPDLIITMSIGSLLEITYGNTLSIPIINSVNGRPDYDYTNVLGGRKAYMVDLLTASFNHLNGIQILFDSYRDFLPSNFSGHCNVIANPIEPIDQTDLVRHDRIKEKYRIIHVGRLDTECKQQHVAISIFTDMAYKYPNWDLEFWGTGADFNRLKDQINHVGMERRIFLRGFTEDPLAKMRDADIFIFPSKYEGFGLALAEAMSIGLPSIGFSTCSGVNELIEHGRNGFLANDTVEMQYYLEQLIDQPELRQDMGLAGNRMIQCYNLKSMADGWLTLIHDVINKQSND
ncbi:glycosyltransferase [Sphingobacterium multivorum]|uniref:glycosyltransferase n=1 Tax=Sphingobacterium multivorum TaxID=28454 RepID=UPI000E00DC91|nr:glycosyltransferase [Sphingobacterium multivorum]QQT42829.1 glycosyltransferase [Sphingobacterium multivorum]SUJ02180.1 Probable poly(glycerol-phosphate) alpha-glucosyltransferase [Sphingobacterium multivorum]HAE65913.1 glycosyltransferase [Sphingobacterium sp.]HBI89915.1 glycosyltransferase [Sphingobacterium sp.]